MFMAQSDADAVIRVRDLVVGFGDRIVLDHLNLDILEGEIVGLIGASGSGKSVLMRSIVGLVPRHAGTVEILGRDLDVMNASGRRHLGLRCGIMFQQGAPFSSLTVKENIQLPMREFLDVSQQLMDELALYKLKTVGLPMDAADKYPAQLSGGMAKRVALARALALDPEIVFLDEPTSGLDPIGAGDFDTLVSVLHHTMKLTIFMVTHDLDSLRNVCGRIVVLANGRIVADGDLETMRMSQDPWVKTYFHGARGQVAFG